MTSFLIFAGIAIGLLVLLVLLVSAQGSEGQKEKSKYSYTKRRYLMTRTEAECYKELVRGLGDKYFIFAQVHLPEIVSEKVGGQNWTAARNHINRKSVDFVLCDQAEVGPVLAIELDDWSHNREDRQERDKEVERILEEAGVPLLRITDMEDLVGRVIRRLET